MHFHLDHPSAGGGQPAQGGDGAFDPDASRSWMVAAADASYLAEAVPILALRRTAWRRLAVR